jgi:GDP-L-fucose synthase
MHWNDRRIVITGGAGMIGASLVRQLLAAGAEVTVVDDFSRGSTEIEGATYVKGDVSNLNVCTEAFRAADGVFNLAAYVAGVLYNEEHHHEMFVNNVLLQTVPVVAAMKLDIRRFVQVSSVCVYAPEHNSPAMEWKGHLGIPVTNNYGYSMAKRLGELAVYGGLSSDAFTIVRPSNCYGPNDYYDERAHVIPALIDKFHRGDGPVTVYGTGKERREFIYVDDVAQGMMAAYTYGQSDAYNLGTDGSTCVSIRVLANAIRRLLGSKREIVFDASKGGGDTARWSDSTLATIDLHWRAQTGLVEGLWHTIQDYRARYLP